MINIVFFLLKALFFLFYFSRCSMMLQWPVQNKMNAPHWRECEAWLPDWPAVAPEVAPVLTDGGPAGHSWAADTREDVDQARRRRRGICFCPLAVHLQHKEPSWKSMSWSWTKNLPFPAQMTLRRFFFPAYRSFKSVLMGDFCLFVHYGHGSNAPLESHTQDGASGDISSLHESNPTT